MTLSTAMIFHYAECRILFTIMVSVVMLNVAMLSVIAPSSTPSPNTIKLLRREFTNVYYKLDRLSLASLSSLAQ
jgi:hypothetical protein